MKLPIDIRTLCGDDATAYKSLRLEAATDPGFGANPADEAAYSTALLARALAPDGDDFVAGAFIGNELIAMVGFGAGVKAEEGTLYGLYVSPGWRRQGLARRLCEALIDREPARTISLRVARDNAPAIALYLSLGFAEADQADTETTMIRPPALRREPGA